MKYISYDREYAKRHPDWLFIFADNTDRDSGTHLINPDRPYIKKYGIGKHFPNVTSACIRGVVNAMPISTQRYYHPGAKGVAGRWKDKDIKEFTDTIEDEIKDIKKYILESNPKEVILPANGLFNSRISAITIDRVPKIFRVLKSQLDDLEEFIVSHNLITLK